MATLTQCTLWNGTESSANLEFSIYEGAKEDITMTTLSSFEQSINSMAGGLVYNVGTKIKWIVAWTNDGKVYTTIKKCDESVTWSKIITQLQPHDSTHTYQGYTSKVNVEMNTNGSLTLEAKLLV
ncbi:hypothetical protein J1N35_029472 [Gossypium stocksii]|uniref:Uncharacterized protein n=1 Tax=Gossypium stocksii TaxID=47602 RepID=A0A9D3UXN3_9ROSI|nr:hypothetical protein J1N35_029472 [Gossypium stocksii]